MRLTGHTSRSIFDRDPIIHEQELLKAEDELVASLARQAQAPRGRAPRTDNPCIGVDDARPDHRGGESHAARFGGAHPASESCDGVAGEGALRWRSFGFVRAHATGATQRRGHEENWEFETHRACSSRSPVIA